MEKTNVQKLALAVQQDDMGEVRRLIKRHPEVFDECDWLMDAAEFDKVDMMELFLSLGSDVNSIDPITGNTPLTAAAGDGNMNAAIWLLDHGADIHYGAGKGPGVLVSAMLSGSLEMASLLIERGADVNATYQRYGEPANPLSMALEYATDDVADLLRKHGARMPVVAPGEPVNSADEIVEHLKEQIGEPQKLALIEIVPARDDVSVAIRVIPPSDERPYVTLFTTGMSDMPMNTPEDAVEYRYAELVMYLPPDWPLDKAAFEEEDNYWPIEWLRILAYYPFENDTWLGPAQTVCNEDPPVPFSPGTAQSSMFLLVAPEVDALVTRDGRRINFYQLTPLYEEERQLQENKGPEALVKLFEKHDIEGWIDMKRVNVAKRSGSKS